MPIRKFNYTNRVKINCQDITISLNEYSGINSFEAYLSLDDYHIPDQALIFIEAYRRTTIMRFDYGTVRRPFADKRFVLSEFDETDAVLFRVRITTPDTPKGMILAEADRIRPRSPENIIDNRISLLDTMPDPNLRKQIYKIDFRSEPPILLINSKLRDWKSVVKNPIFITLTFPTIMREILIRIMLIDKYEYDDSNEDNSNKNWIMFAISLLGGQSPPEPDSTDDIIDWIDEAVAFFCRKHNTVSSFQQHLSGDTI